MNEHFFRDLELIQKDKQQLSAYKVETNTVVIAGPGSGKTKILTLKAVSLLKSSIKKPCGLACISFSRETVRELKKRLKRYGYIPDKKDFLGTVHSFSLLHVIQPYAHLYPQYNVSYPIKILPYDISDQIFESVKKDMGIDNLSLMEVNKYRSLSVSGRSKINFEFSENIVKGAQLYQNKLRKTEYIDFVDIINISAQIISEQEYVRKSIQSKFPWLLIDEYQDLGKALHEMVLELVFNAGVKLYAVGDVNQSIYGFNGGYPEFLHELTKSDEVETIYLESNYRSSQQIIEASLETLKPDPLPKYNAQLRKEDSADFTFITCEEEMEEQYEVVAKKVIPNLVAKGISFNDIGIIAHSNAHIQHLASFLQKEGIAFYIVNWNFENSAVVVWLQECALWYSNPQEESFDNIFLFWIRLLEVHNDKRKNWEMIRLKMIFYDVINSNKENQTVFDWLTLIYKGLELKETLLNSDVYPNEISNLDKLIKEAELNNLKNATINRFAHLGIPNNEVTLTTRHSSKGLEFEAVILLGMEEEHFPSFYHLGNPVALAEDQRLCYVCISRAKNSCVLLMSKFFTIDTRRGPWRKQFAPSRYWVDLYKKFGNQNNTFTNKTYQ